MKKMRTVLAVAGLVLAMAPAARADATWTGGGDGINWSDNDNWNVADITVAGGVFTMTGSGSTTVDADTSTWTAITEVKAFSSSDTLNVGALATYQVNNHKPYGSIFIQTGGTVNITGIKSGNQGTTQISGGSYFANQWRQAYVYAPTAEVLHITGSATTSIQINVFLTQLYAGKDLPEISFTLDASGVTPLQVSAMGTAGNLDKLTINVDGLENYTGPNTPIPLVIDINSAIGVFDRVVAGTITGGNGGILTLGTTTTTDDTIFLTMPYAVTYDGNGHNVGTPPTAQSKWYSVALTLASDIGTLEKTGYTFTGWNTAADGTGTDYALGASYTVNAVLPLFAKWVTAGPYAATYDANTATGGDAPTAQSKVPGVDLTLASDIGTLEKTGYTFTGWNTAADGTGAAYALGASYTADAAVTLFAQWVVASAFAITEIEYDPAAVPNLTVTLTWRLRPGTTYKAFSSLDLIDWSNELADSLGAADDEIPDDGNHITVTFPLTDGLEDEPHVFFRIQEE